MASYKLKIIPLGGAGEIGKNMTVLEYGKNIVIVDCGVMFPAAEQFGVDLVLPDWNYLKDKLELVRGIVVTHGHEDHIGALPYLLKEGLAEVPIFASRLTRGLIEVKLEEHGLKQSANLNTMQAGDRVRVGPFEVEPIRMSHSIPDALALAIRTPVGIIVMSGDYKFDHTPIDGRTTDAAHLARLGAEGVLALLGDSTGAEKHGSTPSERLVADALEDVFDMAPGRIIIATFASQLSRVQQVLKVAPRHNRVVAVVGRSMSQNVQMALELGYLSVPPGVLVSVEEALQRAPGQVVILATGSQGEPSAALSRMANGTHRQVKIEPGDTVVVSAHPIPGNEDNVSNVINKLFRIGADVVYDRLANIHVSGHGGQEDMKLLLSLLQPKIVIPVHGEYRHLVLHARLAEQMGIPKSNIFIIENGQTVVLDEENARLGDRVPGGWVFVDGGVVGDIGPIVLKDREQLARDGFVVAVVTLDGKTGQPVGRPQIVSRGFVYVRDNETLLTRAEDSILATLNSNGYKPGDIPAIETKVRGALNRHLYEETGRRPIIIPVIQSI
jgi:ribonuclease J